MNPLAGEPENGGGGIWGYDQGLLRHPTPYHLVFRPMPMPSFGLLPLGEPSPGQMREPTARQKLARKKRQDAQRRARAITRGMR